MIANTKLTAIYEEQADGSYIAYVEEISGVNTQGGYSGRGEVKPERSTGDDPGSAKRTN